jgi:hypothetical protein
MECTDLFTKCAEKGLTLTLQQVTDALNNSGYAVPFELVRLVVGQLHPGAVVDPIDSVLTRSQETRLTLMISFIRAFWFKSLRGRSKSWTRRNAGPSLWSTKNSW